MIFSITIVSAFTLIYYIYNKLNIKPIINKVKINNEHIYTKNRYNIKKIPNNIDVIIIGSGISGLTAGALLSKTGKKVLVLEQHNIAGGATHSFEDRGIEHETGLHYIGNIKKRKPILDLISYNPIKWSKLGWERKDKKNIYDEIFIGNSHYEFEAGESNLKEYLINKFPNVSKKAFDKYFNLIKKISKKNKFFIFKVFPYKFLSKYLSWFDKDYDFYCKKSAYSVVKNIFDNEELISVLFGQFGDYGITPKNASFFLHASIVNHYLEGGWFPVGGTGVIANEICKTIKHYGGEVLVGKKVNKILTIDNSIIGVQIENGDFIYCNNVISSIGLKNTFVNLVNSSDKTKIYHEMLNNMNSSVQHMYCFVKLKGTPKQLNLRSSNFWIYPHGDYEKVIYEFLEDPLNKPMGLFMGFSCMKDPEWTKKYPNYSNAVILTQVKKEWFEEWKDKKCMKRGNEYNKFKNELGKKMLEQSLYKIYPELKKKVLHYNIATPLTTQHYLNTFDGESYGLNMNYYRLTKSFNLRPKTNIKGLYLTGQDICTMGVVGAMMGGVMTANVVAGYDNILDICIGNNIINKLTK